MSISCRPFFLKGPSGYLFVMHFLPQGDSRNEVVIHVPPLAEEMNKSRHMVAKQARMLCGLGYDVLVVDLFGTGDSEGGFEEATWDRWLDDLEFVYRWTEEQQFEAINWWSLRMGSLLISDLVRLRQLNASRIVCWQPVINGRNLLGQFLRLRIAAYLESSDKNQSVKDYMTAFEKGSGIEVAGYQVSPGLALPLANAKFEDVSKNCKKLAWFQLTTLPGKSIGPSDQIILDQLSDNGLEVVSGMIQGAPFWFTQELSLSHQLLDTTSKYFTH
ncbi:hydrolase 2, exosortase A system-associated [Sedimenticola hydrogenitrophicus]|uniref:hydrolase 2, exosortase A system-associated n=1 Tax=Sedimenticola hydrogenitrophicus TaxID=2967975 RepID=UPI0021A4E337